MANIRVDTKYQAIWMLFAIAIVWHTHTNTHTHKIFLLYSKLLHDVLAKYSRLYSEPSHDFSEMNCNFREEEVFLRFLSYLM